jgi:hypothetical protein
MPPNGQHIAPSSSTLNSLGQASKVEKKLSQYISLAKW